MSAFTRIHSPTGGRARLSVTSPLMNDHSFGSRTEDTPLPKSAAMAARMIGLIGCPATIGWLARNQIAASPGRRSSRVAGLAETPFRKGLRATVELTRSSSLIASHSSGSGTSSAVSPSPSGSGGLDCKIFNTLALTRRGLRRAGMRDPTDRRHWRWSRRPDRRPQKRRTWSLPSCVSSNLGCWVKAVRSPDLANARRRHCERRPPRSALIVPSRYAVFPLFGDAPPDPSHGHGPVWAIDPIDESTPRANW
jgi:hypothetical protein